MTTEGSTTTTEETAPAELPPGYYVDRLGAWLSLPWPGDRALPWGHPSRLEQLPPSLGPEVIRWCEQWLNHHLTGQPWRFTPAQKRFIHLWYALRPDGRWLYRSGVKRGAKGTGKDPFLAALSMVEMCGPVAFDHWGTDRPVGRPHRLALVQIAANSEAQAKDVLWVANAMISEGLKEEYEVDDGILRTQLANGSRIELLTSSERSAEGDPATAIFLNESHHMKPSNGGQLVAAVARRNVGKSPGGHARILEATNAHMPGDQSVAEDSYDAWQAQVAGRTRRKDILYDTREATPSLRLHIEEELEEGIAQAYADSPWTDQERIRDEAQDPRTPLADSVRYYFNGLPTNEHAWVDPRKFDSLARVSEIIADRDPIALFLDCSKSTDATALMAARISDGHVFKLGAWQRPHGDRGTGWLAPREEVDAKVRQAFATWSVQWFGVDPSPARDDETEAQYWGALIDRWHRDFRKKVLIWATPGPKGSAVAFDMRISVPGGRDRNRLFTEAAEQVAADIDDYDPDLDHEPPFTHDGDPMLRVHAHAARRRTNMWGVSLGKRTRDSSALVDCAVAMVGALHGRWVVLNSGKPLRGRRTEAKVVVLE